MTSISSASAELAPTNSSNSKLYKFLGLAALSGGVVFILYRNQHILIKQYNEAIGSNRQLQELNTEMLDNLRATHENIVALKAEIANLKNQVSFVTASKSFGKTPEGLSTIYRSCYETNNSVSQSIQEQEEPIDRSIPRRSLATNRSSIKSSMRRTRSSKSATSNRSYRSGQTFPDSDDECWQSPEASDIDSLSDEGIHENEMNEINTSPSNSKAFDFSRFSNEIVNRYQFINLNLEVYNPKPWSGLPNSIFNVCLQVDELHYKGDDAVLETFKSMEALVKNEDGCIVDVFWRLCRSCLYLSALAKLEKKMDKGLILG